MDRPTDAEQAARDTAPAKKRATKLVPIVVVALVVVAAAIVLSRPGPGTRTITDTSVSVIVSAAEPKQTQTYPIQLLEGGDPGHESDHIIESVRGLPGVASATLDWSSGIVLIVEHDPQFTPAEQIAQALNASGYLVAPSQ